jgi:hypothetical protein
MLSGAPVEAAITFDELPPPVELPPPKPGEKPADVPMPGSVAADVANKESQNASTSGANNSSLATAVTFALPAFMLIFGALALFGAAAVDKRKRHRIVKSVTTPRGLSPPSPHAPRARAGSGAARRRE